MNAAYLGLAFVLALVLYGHHKIPAYQSARARRRGLAGAGAITLLLGLSWAACGFPKSGPITVQHDGQMITGVEITAPAGHAGIELAGHSFTTIYDVIVHHQDKAGIAVHGGHDNLIQNAMIDGGAANSGDRSPLTSGSRIAG